MILGGLVGFGIYQIARGWVPTAPNLAEGVRRYTEDRDRVARKAQAVDQGAGDELTGRAARRIGDYLRVQQPRLLGRLGPDLAVTGTTLEDWLVKVLGAAAAALVEGIGLVAAARALGEDIPLHYGPVIGLVFAAMAVIWCAQRLAELATVRRSNFRRALASYEELVAMATEAGRDYRDAMPAAAKIGSGWAFTEIQDAIDGARFSGITPWEALGQMGERYAIKELVELHHALALSSDGARIKQTLIARSETMRANRVTLGLERESVTTSKMRVTNMLAAMLAVAYIAFALLSQLNASGV